VAPNDPQLRAQSVVVVMLTPADADTVEVANEANTFAALINGCGGIGGRRFDLHVLAESGDPGADCLAATTQFHPLVVVSLAASPAQSCIVDDQQTIMVTASDASNTDLAASSGRLVATGSAEGIEQARLLDLVASGRLNGQKVAVVTGTDPSDVAFQQLVRTVLAAQRIRVVDPGRATAVLEPTLDVATIPLLTGPTTGPQHRPLDVYGFAAATDGVLDQVRQLSGADSARVLRATNLFAFAPATDVRYRSTRSPNTFSEMCNQAYASAVAKRAASQGASSSTTTPPSDASLSATYLQIADVCMDLRIVARGVFAAGVGVDQTSVIAALHRLPYVDLAAPVGTPKPRPNQVVNEPVTRIEQVVVLTQVRSPCPSSSSASGVADSSCWEPVSGWDDGGRVVNVPLSPALVGPGH
jgi:hypothetical protein